MMTNKSLSKSLMYRLQIKESALRHLKELPFKIRGQIDARLKKLAENPERMDLDIKKLKGHDLYRLRSGDYRVIYQKKSHELLILVLNIGDRKEVYR